MFFHDKMNRKNGESSTIDEILNTDAFNSLRIDFKSLDLKIEGGNKFEIRYQGPEVNKPELRNENGIVILKETNNSIERMKNWGHKHIKIEVNITESALVYITIPKTVELENLQAVLASGDCNISDVAIKEISITAFSGDLKAQNIRTNSFDAEVTSGDITFAKMRVDQSNLSLTSGDFKIENSRIEDQLFVSTTSGDNYVKNTKADRYNLNTMNGDNLLFGELLDNVVTNRKEGSLISLKTISGDNVVEK